MNREPLPEIPEHLADHDYARIYEDIRCVTGRPIVNLIYRHLATIPGALEWTWSVVRSLYADARILAASDDLLRMAPTDLDASGGEAARHETVSEREAISTLIAHYNQGNAQNLIVLLAFVSASEKPFPRRQGRLISVLERTASERETIVRPSLSDLPVALRARVADVSERHGGASIGATPSLYRDLARWPRVLEGLLDRVERGFDTGELSLSAAAILERAERESGRLLLDLSAAEDEPSSTDIARARDSLLVFTRRLIPEMLTVGLIAAEQLRYARSVPASES
jgi:hypothetical protein